MDVINHWIGGKPYERAPDRLGDVYDPAAGEVTARVGFAGPEVVDHAVEVAHEAFRSWRTVSLAKRTDILFAFWRLMEDEGNKRELARTITGEHGKVLADAYGEIDRGIEVLEFACGIPHLLKGEFAENVTTSVDSFSLRQPLGVAVGITPFNFPAMVPMWMYPIAIACGNAFVLKPSERDPSAANFMAGLLAEAGLPEGVFNVVHGDGVAVDRLLEHPTVQAVSSVGSTPVARHIYETGTRHGKRVQALGGAKNHMVVLPDADIGFAAESAVSAGYGSTGQRCMAISTVVAVGSAADPFVESVRERVAGLKVGPGLDAGSEMGPLVTGAALERVQRLIESGLEEGADLVVDGRDIEVPGHERGFFLGPCLFDRVVPHMRIYTEEIFGPVLLVVRAESYDDAIRIVNSNPHGNGAAIFTNDGGAARRFQTEVECGMVGINVPIPVPRAFFPFGGWKESLFGDIHVHGPEGVRFYTRGKVVTSRWADPHDRDVRLGFPAADS